jgi:uncharacterized damage-inducible protein DinB
MSAGLAMPDLDSLRKLSRYSQWANKRLFEALAGLPVAELTAIRSEGAGSILKVLNHARVVDLIWRGHLEGKPHGFTSRNTPVLPALGELAADQEALDAWYIAYAEGMDPAAAGEVVEFKFVDGGAGAMTRADMVLHVVNHKTYHRGYVAQMLYQAGLKPPTMDLPVYVRDVHSRSTAAT